MPWNRLGRLRRFSWFLPLFALLASSQNPPTGQQSPQAPGGVPPQISSQPPQPPPILIMLDPAHGGTDSGAVLNAAFPEKDVTLVLARSLRLELIRRGFPVQLVRDGDVTLSNDQRAVLVNAQRPALYMAIHATSQGSGIRVFTTMLPVSGENRAPFLDWQTAQSATLARSRSLAQQLAGALQKSSFPTRSLAAPLRPLNNLIVPAIAIEVAPPTNEVSELASSEFQQSVATALANSIGSIAPMLKAEHGQ